MLIILVHCTISLSVFIFHFNSSLIYILSFPNQFFQCSLFSNPICEKFLLFLVLFSHSIFSLTFLFYISIYFFHFTFLRLFSYFISPIISPFSPILHLKDVRLSSPGFAFRYSKLDSLASPLTALIAWDFINTFATDDTTLASFYKLITEFVVLPPTYAANKQKEKEKQSMC